jgi:ribosome maturation factor RimP
MNFEIIREKVLKVFEKHQLKLYSITEEKLGPDKILTILIDNDELTHEILEPIHYEVLDKINDDIPDGYFLELSTVGLERELRNLDEVIQYTPNYVFIESDSFIGNATLDEVVDSTLHVTTFVKGRKKKLSIPYDSIKFIRLAVKF